MKIIWEGMYVPTRLAFEDQQLARNGFLTGLDEDDRAYIRVAACLRHVLDACGDGYENVYLGQVEKIRSQLAQTVMDPESAADPKDLCGPAALGLHRVLQICGWPEVANTGKILQVTPRTVILPSKAPNDFIIVSSPRVEVSHATFLQVCYSREQARQAMLASQEKLQPEELATMREAILAYPLSETSLREPFRFDGCAGEFITAAVSYWQSPYTKKVIIS